MNNYLEVRARLDALIFSISLLVLLYKSKTSSEDSVDEIESEAQTKLALRNSETNSKLVYTSFEFRN